MPSMVQAPCLYQHPLHPPGQAPRSNWAPRTRDSDCSWERHQPRGRQITTHNGLPLHPGAHPSPRLGAEATCLPTRSTGGWTHSQRCRRCLLIQPDSFQLQEAQGPRHGGSRVPNLPPPWPRAEQASPASSEQDGQGYLRPRGAALQTGDSSPAAGASGNLCR